MKKLCIILFLMIFLSSCAGHPKNKIDNILIPSVSPTSVHTSTQTITPTSFPTATPSPHNLGTCSDPDSIKKVVDAFLAERGFNSYASFLKSLPSYPEDCDNSINGCINMVTDNYLNRWYQTANLRAVLIGSFTAKYKP
jgi:hypothetical protein